MSSKLINGRIVGDDISPEIYHTQTIRRGDPAFVLSRSELMEFDRCPRRWIAGYKGSETKPQEWGTLIDCLALTPDRFDEAFAVAPETYPSKGMECPKCKTVTDSKSCRKCNCDRVEVITQKEWDWNATFCKDWRRERDGLTTVKHADKVSADAAVKLLYNDAFVLPLFETSRCQVLVQAEYQDHETGIIVPLKTLIDLEPNNESAFRKSLADLKTCNCAAAGYWRRAVFTYSYHVQAALFLDVYNCATGEKRNTFHHVLQESFAPFEIGRRTLSSEYIELGRQKYRSALRKYCQCLATNTWPGYDDGAKDTRDGFQLTEPEPWMVMQSLTDHPPEETDIDEIFPMEEAAK